jgi:hypothetical protein
MPLNILQMSIDIKMNIQGVGFEPNFFLLELGGTAAVLGLDWL